MSIDFSSILGTREFWGYYRELTSKKGLSILNGGASNGSLVRIRCILEQYAFSDVLQLKRPRRPQDRINAWLVLATRDLYRPDDGVLALRVRAGDVITIAHQWDRDVFLTHSPVWESVSGSIFALVVHDEDQARSVTAYLLPLFDQGTISRAALIRSRLDLKKMEERLFKEASERRWPRK